MTGYRYDRQRKNNGDTQRKTYGNQQEKRVGGRRCIIGFSPRVPNPDSMSSGPRIHQSRHAGLRFTGIVQRDPQIAQSANPNVFAVRFVAVPDHRLCRF
jgi:hypothetical protein